MSINRVIHRRMVGVLTCVCLTTMTGLSPVNGCVELFAGPHASRQEESTPEESSKPEDDTESDSGKTIQILDSPAVIPPKDVVPEVLGKTVHLNLENAPVQQIADQLGEQLAMTVLLDLGPLKQVNILPSDTVTFATEPVSAYQVLQRLSELRLGWILDKEVLLLTSIDEARDRHFTATIPVGQLRDQDYDPMMLVGLVQDTLGGQWEEDTSVMCLGDVLFVRHNMDIQLKTRALIQALEQPARRTLLLQPESHLETLESLKSRVDIDFEETPLEDALQEIGKQIGNRIFIDQAALNEKQIRSRHPVTLQLNQRPAESALRFLLSPIGLDFTLENGRITVTTQMQANVNRMTAVFDVRDLCPSEEETEVLIDAVMQQTEVLQVFEGKSGVVVVRDTEPMLNEVTGLLENYRLAMRNSKPRQESSEDPYEVLTHYYRMPTSMAQSVKDVLPDLVGKNEWSQKVEPLPEGMPELGTILLLESAPEFKGDEDGRLIMPYSVLVITQRRAVHEKIALCLRQVSEGDTYWEAKRGMGEGGGLGGGGFGGGGGGLFNTPRLEPESKR